MENKPVIWGIYNNDLVEVAHCRGVGLEDLERSLQPKQFCDSAIEYLKWEQTHKDHRVSLYEIIEED